MILNKKTSIILIITLIITMIICIILIGISFIYKSQRNKKININKKDNYKNKSKKDVDEVEELVNEINELLNN